MSTPLPPSHEAVAARFVPFVAGRPDWPNETERRLARHIAFKAAWGGLAASAAWRLLDRRGLATGLERPCSGLEKPVRVKEVLKGRDAILGFASAPSEGLLKLLNGIEPKTLVSWRPGAQDWRVRVSTQSVDAVLAMISEHGLDVGADMVDAMLTLDDRAAALAPVSRATEPSPGFKPPALGLVPMPYQVAGIEYASKARKFIFGDPPGLGKTLQAVGSVEYLQDKPSLVVTTATGKLVWEHEIKLCLPQDRVVVLSSSGLDLKDEATGGDPDPSADWWVINFDRISKGEEIKPEAGKKAKKTKKDYLLAKEILRRFKPRSLVVDEAHYVANAMTHRSKAVAVVAKKVDTRLLLTGTPCTKRPADLVNLLRLVDWLWMFGGATEFRDRYCDPKNNGFTTVYKGATNVEELNRKLRETCYVRREKEEVLTQLPDKRFAVVPCHLAPAALKAYRGLESSLKSEAKVGAAVGQRASGFSRNAALASALADAKIGPALEWIEDFRASGEKLVIFANHRRVVEALAKRLGAPKIYGGTSTADRKAAVRAFQQSDKCREIVLNWASGKEALTLHAASNLLAVETPPTAGDLIQGSDRVHRIGQLKSVTIWMLIVPDSHDERELDRLELGRQMVGRTVEGHTFDANATPFMGEANV